jgi:hypothetical protein
LLPWQLSLGFHNYNMENRFKVFKLENQQWELHFICHLVEIVAF